ncbi:putative lipid-transfer protein DIR1 [Sesamum alatum]|uniref:Lipid-transfer protein DIR1 n=1 Tax=Sesamum alatum TaxID=300844 RepID=A0AAE1YJ93_9LAMI|nr:putative lipid-transfer protein DIR1 [Sesamum alatum]
MQTGMFQKAAILAILLSIFTANMGIHVCYARVCGLSGGDQMACKPSVTPPHPPPPSARCCSGLLHADWRCLCSYRNSKLLPALGIDVNLAMQLPVKCKVPHPPHC